MKRTYLSPETFGSTDQTVEHLAALGEMSASIAHEIRNPLGSISLNLQYLSRKKEIPEVYQKNLRNIELGVARIRNVIEGILDFIRPSPPNIRRADIHSVIDSSIHAVRHDLEEAGIRLKRTFAATPSIVEIDTSQIIHVLENLLLNAKDAMARGGAITIVTMARQNILSVAIQDEGRGISQQHLERIFEPFFSTRRKGIGLGLAIVARIVAMHEGQITVESRVGVGTTFTVDLLLSSRETV